MKIYRLLLLMLLCVLSEHGFAQTHIFPANDTDNSLTGKNSFSITSATPGVYPADFYCSVKGTLDQTCIQNAINAASGSLLGGGTVFIPAGTYTLTGSVTLASNVSLVCSEGWKTQINIVDDGSAGMRKFIGGTSTQAGSSVTNVAIIGCSIQMTGVASRSGVYGLISFYNSSHILLLRNQLGAALGTNVNTASSSTCTYFENTSYFEEAENTCDGTEADGFHVSRASNNFSIHDNWFKFTGDDSIGMVGVVTDDGTHTYGPVIDGSVFGNHINQNGGNTGGLSPNAGGITCVGCARTEIFGNSINTPAGECVAVTAVTGNVNGASTRYPFYVAVHDNGCTNSGNIGNTNAAYVMQFTRASRLHHNTVNVHSADCIFAGAFSKDVIVDHNTVTGCTGRGVNAIQTSTTEARAIAELFTAFNDGTPARIGVSNLTVDHNIVNHNTTTAAIELQGEASLSQIGDTIDANTVYSPPSGQAGIKAIRVSQSTFSNNQVSGAANAANLIISTSDQDLVTGGIYSGATGASGDGFDCLSCTNTIFQDLQARSNGGFGGFIDAGGSNNAIRNSDLRSNSTGIRLIQDTTSVALNNIEANFTGQRNQTTQDVSGASTITFSSGTAVMTTAGIVTGACGTTVTVASTGVLTTDIINISHNAATTIGNGGGLTLNAWPTAGNVNFNYCNSSAGTITPTAMTINWQVTR